MSGIMANLPPIRTHQVSKAAAPRPSSAPRRVVSQFEIRLISAVRCRPNSGAGAGQPPRPDLAGSGMLALEGVRIESCRSLGAEIVKLFAQSDAAGLCQNLPSGPSRWPEYEASCVMFADCHSAAE